MQTVIPDNIVATPYKMRDFPFPHLRMVYIISILRYLIWIIAPSWLVWGCAISQPSHKRSRMEAAMNDGVRAVCPVVDKCPWVDITASENYLWLTQPLVPNFQSLKTAFTHTSLFFDHTSLFFNHSNLHQLFSLLIINSFFDHKFIIYLLIFLFESDWNYLQSTLYGC